MKIKKIMAFAAVVAVATLAICSAYGYWVSKVDAEWNLSFTRQAQIILISPPQSDAPPNHTVSEEGASDVAVEENKAADNSEAVEENKAADNGETAEENEAADNGEAENDDEGIAEGEIFKDKGNADESVTPENNLQEKSDGHSDNYTESENSTEAGHPENDDFSESTNI